MPHSDRTRFAPGQFLGARQHSAGFGSFAVSLHIPTVPPQEVQTHTHSDPHFVLVLAGEYHSTARDWQSGVALPGLIFNPAGTTHRDRFQQCSGARFLTISVGDASASEIDPAPRRLRHRGARALPPHGAALASRLASHLSDWDDGARLAGESVCFELLAMAMHAPPRRASGGPAWIASVCDRLRDVGGHAPTIASLAESVGLHPVYLAREFRRAVGCSPGEYLRQHRCERAAAALATSRRPLADIALELGFADQSHFTRQFKRAFGLAPSVYRARRYGRVARVQDAASRRR